MQIDLQKFPAAEVSKTSIPLMELLDGSKVDIPIVIMRGGKPGPVLYLGAAMHGDEVMGIEIIRRIFCAVNPTQLRGAIIGVPLQNPLSARERRRFIPEHFDYYVGDAHTAFPGDRAGEPGSYLAHCLFEHVVKTADVVIDIHTAMAGGVYLDHAFASSAQHHTTKRARELARLLNTPLVIAQDQGLYTTPGMLHEVAAAEGIVALGAEYAVAGEFTDEGTASGTEGILNVMRELDMLDGDVTKLEEQFFATDMTYVRARRGGLLHLAVRVGQTVKQGDVLGYICNMYFEKVETVTAPRDGVVYRLSVPRPINARERVAGLAYA